MRKQRACDLRIGLGLALGAKLTLLVELRNQRAWIGPELGQLQLDEWAQLLLEILAR